MKEKEIKKWKEMKTLGKKKFVIAEGIISTGLLSGGVLSYIFAVFFLKTNFFLVAAILVPIFSLLGLYAANKKWIYMERIEAYDKKHAQEALQESNDDLSFLDTDKDKESL